MQKIAFIVLLLSCIPTAISLEGSFRETYEPLMTENPKIAETPIELKDLGGINETIETYQPEMSDIIYSDNEQILVKTTSALILFNLDTLQNQSIVEGEKIDAFLSPTKQSIAIVMEDKSASPSTTKLYIGNVNTLSKDIIFEELASDTETTAIQYLWANDEQFVISKRAIDPTTPSNEIKYSIFEEKNGLFILQKSGLLTVNEESLKKMALLLSPSLSEAVYYSDKLNLISLNERGREGLIDDIGELMSPPFWSPNGQYLVYTTHNPWKSILKIFDTTQDSFAFGKINLPTFEKKYDSKNIELCRLTRNPDDVYSTCDSIEWIDEDNLLLMKSTWSDPGSSEYGYSTWIYNAKFKRAFQASTSINKDETNSIEDLNVSTDLTLLVFIKNNVDFYVNSKQYKQDHGEWGNRSIPQELWIANLDGSEARMIYKNY